MALAAPSARSSLLPLLAVLPALWPAASQHATYRFATKHSSFNNLTTYMRWMHIEQGNVYLATKFFTGCSIGRFGGQIHSDGTHALLLSLWDYDGIAGSVQGRSSWCSRFSQGTGRWPKGTGAHCVIPFTFSVSKEYRFELTKEVSGNFAVWSLAVDDGTATYRVGSINVEQQDPRRDCAMLEPEAESDLEYYTGGVFHTEAAWRGPFLGGAGGLAPVDVDVDCGSDAAAGSSSTPANVSSAIPGMPGPPGLIFRRGSGVAHGCERRSFWRHGETLAGAGMAGPLAASDPSGPTASSVMLWVGASALLAVGTTAAVLTARHKCGMTRALAMQEDLESAPSIRDDPKQRLALLNTDADDLASEASHERV